VYIAPEPVYVRRPTVVVAPAPVWYYGGHRGHHRGWEHRHGRHWR
jgi:hypothetical protein